MLFKRRSSIIYLILCYLVLNDWGSTLKWRDWQTLVLFSNQRYTLWFVEFSVWLPNRETHAKNLCFPVMCIESCFRHCCLGCCPSCTRFLWIFTSSSLYSILLKNQTVLCRDFSCLPSHRAILLLKTSSCI